MVLFSDQKENKTNLPSAMQLSFAPIPSHLAINQTKIYRKIFDKIKKYIYYVTPKSSKNHNDLESFTFKMISFSWRKRSGYMLLVELFCSTDDLVLVNQFQRGISAIATTVVVRLFLLTHFVLLLHPQSYHMFNQFTMSLID